MRILIDMDGVVADLEKQFLRIWRARYPGSFFVPLEESTAFYIMDDYPEELKPLVDEIYWEPGFFKNMEIVPGAREALTEMQAMGFDVFLCSSPLRKYRHCVLEKYEWAEMNLGFDWTQRMILTRDKTVVQGDLLIDDKPTITGVESNPAWEHVLYDRPYNRAILNKRRLVWDTWKETLLLE